MIKKIAAVAVQITGVGLLAYAGFLVAEPVGFGVAGVGVCLFGVMLEREVS